MRVQRHFWILWLISTLIYFGICYSVDILSIPALTVTISTLSVPIYQALLLNSRFGVPVFRYLFKTIFGALLAILVLFLMGVFTTSTLFSSNPSLFLTFVSALLTGLVPILVMALFQASALSGYTNSPNSWIFANISAMFLYAIFVAVFNNFTALNSEMVDIVNQVSFLVFVGFAVLWTK